MHILILGINFYSELTGIGKYTGEMAVWLQEQGHQVAVITAPPYYPQWQVQSGYRWWQYKREKHRGTKVWRCPLWVPRKPTGITRLMHLLSFAISSFPVLMMQIKWKPDLVMCIAPAIFNAPFALLTARISGAKSWLHIQDFELDTALQLDMLPTSGSISSWARKAEEALLKRFNRVSTISNRMLDLLLMKEVPEERTYLFPNWVDTDIIFPLSNDRNVFRKILAIPQDAVVVLYAGNMGKKQGIEYIVEAAKYLQGEPSIQFVLCGEGAVRDEMVKLSSELNNLHFLPLQPVEKLNSLLNMADIHVLPQKTGAADLVMPSKLTGMLASGKAVIAMSDEGTEVAKVIDQVGIRIPPENTQSLIDAIIRLAKNKSLRIELGVRGRKFAEEYWDRNRILNALQIEINSFVKGKI